MPVRPTSIINVVGHEELVGLKEKEALARKKLRDTEVDIEGADAPKVFGRIFSPSADESAQPTYLTDAGARFA